MDNHQHFCLACGRLSVAAYCNDQCEQHGRRYCYACGTALNRGPNESAYWFRKRKSCGSECKNRNLSERTISEWRDDPTITARRMRGILLSQNSVEHVQRASRTMSANWQNAKFLEAMKNRPRRFTPEQVRSIRADSRGAPAIGRTYKVSHQTITKIRLRFTYADIPDE